jgi:hypothetical protein
LTAVSKSRLRATLQRSTDLGPLSERLRLLLKGTKTRTERVDKLVEQISAAADPLEAWHAILDELLELAWLRVEDEAVTTLPSIPKLDNAGWTQKEKLALAKQLEPPAWLELLLFDLEDLPKFGTRRGPTTTSPSRMRRQASRQRRYSRSCCSRTVRRSSSTSPRTTST